MRPHEDSQHLTFFISPFEVYKWRVLHRGKDACKSLDPQAHSPQHVSDAVPRIAVSPRVFPRAPPTPVGVLHSDGGTQGGTSARAEKRLVSRACSTGAFLLEHGTNWKGASPYAQLKRGHHSTKTDSLRLTPPP